MDNRAVGNDLMPSLLRKVSAFSSQELMLGVCRVFPDKHRYGNVHSY